MPANAVPLPSSSTLDLAPKVVAGMAAKYSARLRDLRKFAAFFVSEIFVLFVYFLSLNKE